MQTVYCCDFEDKSDHILLPIYAEIRVPAIVNVSMKVNFQTKQELWPPESLIYHLKVLYIYVYVSFCFSSLGLSSISPLSSSICTPHTPPFSISPPSSIDSFDCGS